MKGKNVTSFDQVKSLVITPEIKAKPSEVPVPAAAAAPMKAGKNAPKPLKGKVTARTCRQREKAFSSSRTVECDYQTSKRNGSRYYREICFR